MKLARLALLAAAGVVIAAFAGVLQPSGAHSAAADTSTGGITVLGTGSANVIPNRASFAFGTVSQAATATAALAASSQSVAHVIAALKKASVARRQAPRAACRRRKIPIAAARPRLSMRIRFACCPA